MNSDLDWFLIGAVVPEDLAASALEDLIAAQFGLRGANYLEAKSLNKELEQVVAEVGAFDVTNMTASEANQIMAGKGYTTPPFTSNVNAFQFSTNASQTAGDIAGSQLVRVSSDASSPGGSWRTTLDQKINPHGSTYECE